MPFVASIKEIAAKTSAEQALALTSPFDERQVLTDHLLYLADTLEVSFDVLNKFLEVNFSQFCDQDQVF